VFLKNTHQFISILKGKEKNIPAADSEIDYLFSGGGEMGYRIKNFDWSKTSIGPIETWPQSLKTIVRIMLTSRQPIWIGWGPDLIKLYNDPYKSIVGGKHPDALGKPASEVWSEIWQAIAPMLHQVMYQNEGTYVESQLLIMERYGYSEETYYTFSYNPVPDENGQVGGMFCTNTDDTQRVIGERQLALLRILAAETIKATSADETCSLTIKSLKQISADIPFALIYMFDENTNEYKLSGNFGIEWLDKAKPEVIKAGDNSFWPFEQLQTKEPIVVEDLSTKYFSFADQEWDHASKQAVIVPLGQLADGHSSATIIMGLNPLRRFDDSYESFIKLVAGQISSSFANVQKYEFERKKIHELEELDKAKTAFFSNISHEFRTPITLMLGPLEELLNKPQTKQNKHEKDILEITHRNAMRLLKLVNSLLDFSRIESGRQQANFELEDIVEMTRELASNFISILEKAGLDFEIEATSFIQPVYIDKEMWEKIVFNLLSNAFKYTLKGKITLKIYSDNHHAVLEVSDTGIGIGKKELPKIFERFHRSQNAIMGRSFEGTGIGLSLVKEMVNLHGGTIDLTSTEGKGSTFTVKIPFGKKHIKEENIRKNVLFDNELVRQSFIEDGNSLLLPNTSANNNAIDKDRATVLVVDDNADMRQYLVNLINTKYNVITAVNGLDALHQVQKRKPDLLLSDIMMPIMNGFDLLKHIRSQESTRAIPFIILSARAGEEATIEGVGAGADDYLIKPFSAKELLARISAHIEMAAARKKAELAAGSERRRLYELFMQAPAAIAVLRGPTLVFELANPLYLEVARKNDDIIGKPIFQALPEIKGQTIEKILLDVYNTGKPYIGKEVMVKLMKHKTGIAEDVYFNFVYQPFLNEHGAVDGIMVHAVDVTDQVTKASV